MFRRNAAYVKPLSASRKKNRKKKDPDISKKGMPKKHPLFVSKKLEDSTASISTTVISAAEEKKQDQPAAVVSATTVVIATERTISTAG